MSFLPAGPAEIVRSAQKDSNFLLYLKNNLADILQKTFGTRLWLTHHKWIDMCCELLYFTVTTLSLRQTLGEEYTGILLVKSKSQLPSAIVRTLMVALQCCGPSIMKLLINKLEKSLQAGLLSEYLRPELKVFMLSQMPSMKAVPSFFLKLHLAAFYLGGSFYHLSKRITGIRYVLLRHWFGDGSTVHSFKLLGLIIFLNTSMSLLYSTYNYYRKKNTIAKEKSQLSEAYIEPSKQCSLCLDKRKSSSVTPCGHLFCWNCIHESLQSNNVCPLCRHPTLPNEVVPLMNYE